MRGDTATLAALKDAVASLLEARGARAESEIVRSGALHLLPDDRTWSVGDRDVLAQAFELSLEASDFARLATLAGGRERVKDALADAVSSAETMLASLHVVLRLPDGDGGWRSAYRSAPRKEWEPPSDSASVLAAAVALLDAEGRAEVARVIERGRLAYAELPADGESPLRRWVVSLAAADMAWVQREAATSEAIRRAVTLAATRPRDVVAGVELGVVATTER
jgi:hypothetical protein